MILQFHKMRHCLILFLGFSFFSCGQGSKDKEAVQFGVDQTTSVSLVVLGTVQDAGSPHIACEKVCCDTLFKEPDASRKVVSLGIVDYIAQKTFLFEATPDMTTQLRDLRLEAGFKVTDNPDGIFLTHAHIGHYTGLVYLGKEAVNAKKVPVYAMSKMKGFLENNGPWSQLVDNQNIAITPLENNKEIKITAQLKVIPLTVPHRDEYSETVGYKIIGPTKKVLFIPDIDKWQKWKTSIVSEIEKVDYAFLDATFYDAEEINNRDISEIPHPFVVESMELFKNLSPREKKKVHFIHFNHTNPLLNNKSKQAQEVLANGFAIATKGNTIKL